MPLLYREVHPATEGAERSTTRDPEEGSHPEDERRKNGRNKPSPSPEHFWKAQP